MKTLLSTLILILTILLVNAQPCKKVKIGMSKAEVLKLVGIPTEIDTIGYENYAERKGLMVVWQYGDVNKEGNQRVSFHDDKVDSEVIADGLKFEALMKHFMQKEITYAEYKKRLKKLNKANCR